ncbi:MAG: hypothetical protein AB7G44_12525 [Bacteroidia bacterium]
MKKGIITAILQLAVFIGYAQHEKEVYQMKNNAIVENILRKFDPGSSTCLTPTFSVGSYAELIVSQKFDDNTIVVVLSSNDAGDGMAEINKYYCISKTTLETYFRKKSKPDIGILAVPFKMRIYPLKIMAGNSVGPYIGHKFYHKNSTTSTLLGFASLTNVPLNDVNEKVPQTKWGLGLGGGYVWTVTGNFQVGLISGVDFFEGVDKWVYKFQPWLSLSIGYNFISQKKEEETLKNAE